MGLPNRRTSIRQKQANWEKPSDNPTVSNPSRRRADFRKEAELLDGFTGHEDLRLHQLGYNTKLKSAIVNRARRMVSKKREHLEATKLFEAFVRKEKPDFFEIVNLKHQNSKQINGLSVMQYVKRPSVGALISFLKEGHTGKLQYAEQEVQYIKSLVKSLQEQGLSAKDILQLAEYANNEIKKLFYEFTNSVNTRNSTGTIPNNLIHLIRRMIYSPSNFIFVGVNKQGQPKIAFVDV
jgi:hypothetical protein